MKVFASGWLVLIRPFVAGFHSPGDTEKDADMCMLQVQLRSHQSFAPQPKTWGFYKYNQLHGRG